MEGKKCRQNESPERRIYTRSVTSINYGNLLCITDVHLCVIAENCYGSKLFSSIS
jgi:hypothetical protein